jgi:ABC-type uncharacterized transport system permease subunit
MRTILSVLFFIAGVFLFLGAFHVITLNFDPTLFGLGLTIVTLGGTLFAKVWLKPINNVKSNQE